MHCQGTLRGTIDQTCARSTASGLAVSVAGLQACAATCARRHESHKHFCGACLAPARRVGSEHVDLGRTSTPELACDAGTPGTLSAGDLGGCGKLAHLLFSCSSAASQRDLQILTPVYLSCSATCKSFSLGSRWFDDARLASSNHVVAARRGRTAWTREVHQARCETFRLDSHILLT